MINLPLSDGKDAFYDTKTTCFALRSIIAFIHSNGDNLPLTNNKRSLYVFATDHDAHHGEVVVGFCAVAVLFDLVGLCFNDLTR